MNELAKKWIEELKKNPPKGKTKLCQRGNNGFCCLGVFSHFVNGRIIEALYFETDLTNEERDKLGLHSYCGRTIERRPLRYNGKLLKDGHGDFITSLANLNDLLGFSHAQHAEIILENQDILFKERS